MPSCSGGCDRVGRSSLAPRETQGADALVQIGALHAQRPCRSRNIPVGLFEGAQNVRALGGLAGFLDGGLGASLALHADLDGDGVARKTLAGGMPRDAQPQADWSGMLPVERKDLAPGDLLYFGRSDKKITHTGIYLGDGKFINATTYQTPMVRIDDLNEEHWTKLLVAMRRPK